MGGDARFIIYGTLPTGRAGAAPARRAAAFLDRDGVLNIDHGHVHKPQNFDWVAGAAAAVRRLSDLGYCIIVVTNQSGIARGLYDDATFKALSDWMVAELGAQGGRIDAVYYCPHHPTAGLGALRMTCDCRKPAPGMLLAAMDAWHIDGGSSFFIGDKDTDLAAAAAAGVRGLLFSGGNLDEFIRRSLSALPAIPEDQGATS
ncbi:MAG: D-glycero-beta-D-manno-heptose 1,7-bisphosphate 7-phosphatase [Alphaproteobacteria bacterium]|nr:D-glycero-beta-D-manno-heptose 1,7-bisphosphate 7-phosphatase [Alphaproteobacteria bacterium]